MAQPWNPNSPTVYGIEEPITRHGRTKFSSFSKAFVQKWVPLATETVEWVTLGFPLPVAELALLTDPNTPFRTMLDVYTADPTNLSYTFVSFTPNAFTDRAGFVDQAAGTTNLHLVVDESVDAADHSNYIISTSTASTPKVDFQFGTAAWPAGRRVLDVRVRARVRGGDIGFTIYNSNVQASEKIKTGYTGVVGSTGFRTVSAQFGEICPWTDQPWTQADIALFDSTAEVRVSREDSSTGFFSPTVAALELQILYTTESRVAYGYSDSSWNLQPWFPYDMRTPTGGTSWAKVAGTTYWLVWRRARVEQNPYLVFDPFPARNDFDVPWTETPATGHAVWPEAYIADTGVGGRVNTLGTALARRAVFAVSLDPSQNDAGFPTNGQPYGEVKAADLSVAALRQRIVAPASANYSVVRLYFTPGPVGSEAVTTVRLRNAATLVQVGGTATVTRSTLTDQGTLIDASGTPGEVWSVQLVLSSAAALVSGTAYFLEVSGGGGVSPVYVDVPDGRSFDFYAPGAPSFSLAEDWFGQTGFGDDDARVIVDVGLAAEYESGSGDLLFVIGQQPASLVGFAVAADEQLLTNVTPDTDCDSIDALPLARVSWTASALSDAQFLRYEVERYDPTTDTWTTIARLTSKSATTWYDPDIRFGVAEAYRVRQIAAGEVPSDYTGDTTTTLLLDAPGCGLFFTVAEDQEWNVAALDVYGGGPADREFTWLDQKVYVPMYGRDYQVAFQPTETRGVAFGRTLLLNAISALSVPTYDTFEWLRDLARAPVSALCVRDHDGNRWYMGMEVPSGRLRSIGELAYAQIELTEVAGGPVAYEGRGQLLGGS